MGRQEKIARSVVRAVTTSNGIGAQSRSPVAWLLTLFSIFFSLYEFTLRKIRPADFGNLRRKYWKLSDDDYFSSFQPAEGEGGHQEDALTAIGDMGFSGSVISFPVGLDWRSMLTEGFQ